MYVDCFSRSNSLNGGEVGVPLSLPRFISPIRRVSYMLNSSWFNNYTWANCWTLHGKIVGWGWQGTSSQFGTILGMREVPRRLPQWSVLQGDLNKKKYVKFFNVSRNALQIFSRNCSKAGYLLVNTCMEW